MRIEDCRNWLRTFDFKNLFTEGLGWDNHSLIKSLPIDDDGNEVQLTAIAQKRGLVAFASNTIPDAKVRLKINRQLTKLNREHFVIYTNQKAGKQVWYWVRHEQGKPLSAREHHYDIKQNGDLLIQKLNLIKVSMADEEKIDLTEMLGKTKKAFDVEKVTKRFYDRFSKVHVEFLNFIEGIPEAADQEWYASVMLNRLMFVYFIQRKGFLDGDHDYLRNRLKACQEKAGDGKFHTFYRYFLVRLFHEGLGKRKEERKSGLEKILGKVPYLNGGIFDVHELESSRRYGKSLEIPDKAFVKIFDYFDQYQWNLDERPLRADNEINPDVLGYIFEKYINQKQMGAYYTKEDITEYISKNTIIPFLFDSVRAKCPHHFENIDGPTIWDLQMVNPDRYIYPAMQHGKDLPLPSEVEKGLDTSLPNLIKRRQAWNKPAPEGFGLPNEIWRETVARIERYEEIFKKLEKGQVRNINDFITYNLDIRQFGQDVIDNCDDPDLIQALWHSISNITILDPTGGSGAFLFAALNILEPVYEACLEKMQSFLDEWGGSGRKDYSKYHKIFTEVLNQVESHPNRRYFILKSIILNNLYAVDIMEEAVEICKLRLFLKLASQVDPDDKKDNFGIEPLPDIDFNIRAGNTLVGYTTYDEVKHAITSKFDFDNTMGKIQAKAESIQKVFDKFRIFQTEGKTNEIAELKQQVKKELTVLEDELNKYLAGEYGVRDGDKVAYAKWVKSHQPFHWFIQFYGILKNGGFDVIIGNPPYVEYKDVKKDYLIKSYDTETCGNLYGFVIECCLDIMRKSGRMGMIVQLPIVCTNRMQPLQNECLNRSDEVWFSNFDDRPGKLFDGLEHIRATVVILRKEISKSCNIYTTTYNRWYSDGRSHLFNTLNFESVVDFLLTGTIPKVGHLLGKKVQQRIARFSQLHMELKNSCKYEVYFHNAPQYWIRAMTFAPYFWNQRNGEQLSTQVKTLYLEKELDGKVVAATLNSTLFYWWFIVLSDCRHLNLREIEAFHVGLDSMEEVTKKKLAEIVSKLMKDYKKHSIRTETVYKTTGKVVYDEYHPRFSKSIIDEIDTVLAQHYGFTEEELDFIINYDIKYRMGKEIEGD